MAAVLAPACVADDADRDLGEVEVVARAVRGGQAATTCQWPNAIFGRGCSATLVHPRLITTASHCVQDMQMDGVANFGELAPFARTVQRQVCRRPPEYTRAGQTGAYDIAFCLLREPVENVPIVPILSACEAEQVIKAGKEVFIVGFGAPNNGRKFSGRMVITSVRNGAEVFLRGEGVTAGGGDSGGPAYVEMPDGTWRTFGVASRASGNNVAIYTLISPHIPWLEQTSGLDLSPCHGASGGWQDGPGCDRFPTDPDGTANGTWADFCAASPVAKPMPSCSADWRPGDAGGLNPPRIDGAPGTATNADGAPPTPADAAVVDAAPPPPPAPPPAVPQPPAAPDTDPPKPPDARPATPEPPPTSGEVSTPRDEGGCACALGSRPGSGLGPGPFLSTLGLCLLFRRRRARGRRPAVGSLRAGT